MAGFTTCSPRTVLVPMKPFKNKVYKSEDQGPGKRSLPGRRTRLKVITLAQDPGKRSLPGRPRNTYLKRCLGASCAPAGPGERQASGPGKITTPTRCLPGKPTLCARAPAHLPTRRPGALPGTRDRRLCSLGHTVASHGDEATAVANGEAWTDAFGSDGDGHLMPLSPTVKVR